MSSPEIFPTPPPSPVYSSSPPPSPAARSFLSCSQEALLAPSTLSELHKSQELKKRVSPLRKSDDAVPSPFVPPPAEPKPEPKPKADPALMAPYRERFRKMEAQASSKPIPEKERSTAYPEASLKSSEDKNRYPDVLPTSLGLVTIKAKPGYINANHFEGMIITQGPLKATVEDFWLMVFENSSQIVCLTNHMDFVNGVLKEKTHPYWTSDFQSPLVKVRLVEGPMVAIPGDSERVTRRIFEITVGDKVKRMTHWHYENWPDHGICDSMKLAGLVNLVLDHGGDPTVHCSAGIGRSGVFAGAKVGIEKKRATGTAPSEQESDGTIVALRKRRPMSVQNPAQLKLIADSLK